MAKPSGKWIGGIVTVVLVVIVVLVAYFCWPASEDKGIQVTKLHCYCLYYHWAYQFY